MCFFIVGIFRIIYSNARRIGNHIAYLRIFQDISKGRDHWSRGLYSIIRGIECEYLRKNNTIL